jgi:hypothetical protein
LQHMLHTLYVAKVINAELFVKYMWQGRFKR